MLGEGKMMDRAFRGKTVVMTGAAGGVGGSMARRLAPHWSRALLLDINEAGLEAVAREVDPGGSKVVSRAVDLTDEAGLLANRLVPGAFRTATTVNGYLLNKRRGRV